MLRSSCIIIIIILINPSLLLLLSKIQVKDINGLQHKGTMSTKPVFEKIAKTRRSYVQLRGHMTFVLLMYYDYY